MPGHSSGHASFIVLGHVMEIIIRRVTVGVKKKKMKGHGQDEEGSGNFAI